MKIQKIQVLLFSISTMIFVSCGDTEIIYKQRIAVIGDSISEGWNPDYSRFWATYGWVEMLNGDGGGSYPAPQTETVHTLWNPTLVSNFSKGGSKASEWNRASWLNPVVDSNPDIVIVYLGGNDMLAYIQGGGITEDEINELDTNIREIISYLQDALPHSALVLLDYYDLFDGYSENITISGFEAYQSVSEATTTGNTSLAEVAVDLTTTLVSIYDVFLHHGYGRDFNGSGEAKEPQFFAAMPGFDIHPNTHGHKAIYEQVYATLAALQAGE